MNTFGGLECQQAADDNFGPVVASCVRLFDFTLLFEQAVLSTIPSAVFLVLAPWRLRILYLSSLKTRRSWLSIAKPTNILALISSQLILLVFYCTQPAITRTAFSIPATVLALAAAVTNLPLSYLEQRRSVRPSTLLNSYLALSTILDLPQARTLYLLPGQRHLAATFSAVLAAKALLLALETWNKRQYLIGKYQTLATETTSGIFSRSLFLWMNDLFKRGYRKVISSDDLGPIDSNLGSARVHQQLQDVWTRQDRPVNAPLLRSLWKALRWSILSPVPPRLCYSGFLFAQPFLINRATTYLTRPSNALEDDVGYGLIGAAACTYVGIAVSYALFQHQLYRHITMVRGALVSLIYTQSLTMEDRIDDLSAAVTLMSTDVDRICQSLILLHDLWSRPLELIVGITLLALQIGWVCIMPITVVVISAILDSRVTMLIGNKVKIWSDAVQQRISLTANVLSSMKSVKMLGLVKPLYTLMHNERLHELSLQAKFRWSTIWLNTLGNVPPALAPAVTFVTYAIKAHLEGSKSLNTSQVFTSLALINLVSTPASELLAAFPFAASCLGCVERIQNHLIKPSRQDQRTFTQSRVDISEKKTESKQNVEMIVACLTQVEIPMHDGAHSLLQNLNLEFRQNSFTMLIGPSGSGKSTLLRAILSEVSYSGTISLGTSRIAYCPQMPWVFTGTIRQNICGLEPGPVDEDWYKSVLYSCALDSVLLALPHGDNTRVEGQSSSLSGGQKQRIILARVLYQRPQLLLLDDILSALDIKTEVHIMTQLFGANGVISRLGATVILVTHTHRWETLADSVITLDGGGNVTQDFNSRRPEMALFTDSTPVGDSFPEPGPSDTSETEQANSNSNPDELPHIESPSQHGGDFGDYVFYFKTVRWPVILMFVLSAGAQTVCYYISQAILNWWTADHGSDEAKWLPLYLTMAIGNAIMYGCTAWIMFLKLVPQSAANLHKILLDVVMNAPYSFFTSSDIGTILNRFSQDMTLVESQLPTGVLCTLIYFFWTVGSLALISLGSSWMALTIPAVFITLYCVQRVYLRTSRRLRAIELELRSPIYSHFMESLKGLSTIRTLRWEHQFTNSMISKLDDSQVPYYLLYCAQRWLQLVLDLMVAALAVVVMALAVRLRNSTQPGSLGLSLNNILGFNQTLTILLQFWTQLEVSLGAIARTKEFSLTTPSELKPIAQISVDRSWPNHGQIEICDISAHYAENKVALSNITLSIRPGEKIGLCGRSGSGKSSLLSAVLRLLEPSHGSITIDGVNLANIDHKAICERLISIPQDPFLMQQTVRFNLDPRATHDDIAMITALSKVSLWAILEKRGGLEAKCTSELLSQGQKQLFSLARALLRKESASSDRHASGGVVLLDEATSNIDMSTDALMQRVIRDEFSACTILVVAHRLDTILDSDRIAVLDDGRLVEFDSPQALLSRSSAFSALYNARETKDL
ncbi:hypothetical protein B7463_g10568, partial [Scytalidium lignicola]